MPLKNPEHAELVRQVIRIVEGQNWTDLPLTERERDLIEMAVPSTLSLLPMRSVEGAAQKSKSNFEYDYLWFKASANKGEVISAMNKKGEAGWEMFSTHSGKANDGEFWVGYCFKRRLNKKKKEA